jgi:glycosyltransferase involved in cell wall biosynthesis
MIRLQLSVVVPCYNEQLVLPELEKRLLPVCRQQVGDAYEVILVNDGSSDGTWSLIARMAATTPNVVGVNLSRHVGHQLALTAGLTLCRGDRVLIIDADLQDPPELLAEMMAAMDRGADVVFGQRVRRESEGLFKRSTAFVFYRLLSQFSEVEIPQDTGDFRLINRKVLDVLNQMPEQHRFIRGMVAWLGFTQVPLPYARERRFAGTTKYPFWKMARFAADAITGFSITPLRISSLLAMLCFLLTGLLSVYVLYSWVELSVVRGWTSLLLLFLFFSGVQLLVLGVIGEYVGRTYVETKRRPLFLVSEITTHESPVVSHNSIDTPR